MAVRDQPIAKDLELKEGSRVMGIERNRIKPIDVVRGIAVVQMVFWQIFDFLVKGSIYTDAPYAIEAFNAPPHFSVLVLFLTMSGASLYVSMSKRLKKGNGRPDMRKRIGLLKHTIKRYGTLILISLFFTTFVFGFCTFFKWEEAIQGIGLTAIVTSLILLAGIDSMRLLFLLVVALLLIQPLIVANIWPLTDEYLFCVTNTEAGQFVPSLLVNASVRSFFSFTNLLPLMLVGVMIGKASESGLIGKKSASFMLLGFLLVLSAILMHFCSLLEPSAGFLSIDFYARSYSTLTLEIGIAVALFSFVEHIHAKSTKGAKITERTNGVVDGILEFFVPFGVRTLVAYFGHFLLVYKLLEIIGDYTGVRLLGNVHAAPAAALSMFLVVFFRQLTVEWLKRPKSFKKIFVMILILFLTLLPLSYVYSIDDSDVSVDIGGTSNTSEALYVLMTVDVERDLVPFLDSYDGITDGLPLILDLLREHEIKATFFVTGNVASRYPDTIDQIYEEGHEIGGQGLMHERLSGLSYQEKLEIIAQTTDLLEKYDVKAFRSPYQSSDNEVFEILRDMGYCAEASYDPIGKTHEIEESMIRITSAPLFYPSSTYPNSWTDVFKQSTDWQSGARYKIIVVGIHSWEVLEMPETEGAEEYVVPSGNYTYTNMVSLLYYLEYQIAAGQNIRFVTAKEVCGMFFD